MTLMLARLRFRLAWYRGCWQYDRRTRPGQWPPYLLMFGPPSRSCRHRSRRWGLPCLREITYAGWCGLHNSMCSHDGLKCDGVLPPV